MIDTPPRTADLFDAVELTWPAARLHRAGPWLIREGQGGGKRVSAASLLGETPDIAQMEDDEDEAEKSTAMPGLIR